MYIWRVNLKWKIMKAISFSLLLVFLSCTYGTYKKDGYTVKHRSCLLQKNDVTTFKYYDSSGNLRKKKKIWMYPENPLTVGKDITIEWTDSLKIKTTQVSTGKRDTIYVKEI